MHEKLNNTIISVAIALFLGAAIIIGNKSEEIRILQHEVKSLQHEVEIRDERILDIQTTCRTYEDEIIKLYGELENVKNSN